MSAIEEEDVATEWADELEWRLNAALEGRSIPIDAEEAIARLRTKFAVAVEFNPCPDD